MTSKEYLKNYKNLFLQEENIENEIEYFKKQITKYPNSQIYFHEYLQNEKAAAEAKLKEIKATLKEIRRNIKQIDDDFLKDLLIYRYIDFLSWEEITEILSTKYKQHSLNNVKQYNHNKALEALQNILDKETLRQ